MAVQYNSDTDSWTTWIDKLKQEVPTVKKKITDFFESMKAQGVPLNEWAKLNDTVFNDMCKQYKVTDTELKNFLRTWDGSGDVAEAFQAHLKKSTNGLTLFQRAGKAAGNAIKSIGAAIGSMAATWAIGEVLSLVFTGIDSLLNQASNISEKAEGFASTMDAFNSSVKEGSSQIDDLANKYEKLSEGVDNSGNNVSLTAEQYSEYKDTVSKLSDIMPDHISLLNSQGEKIGFVGGKLKDVNKEYREYLKNQATSLLNDEDENDNSYKDTLDDYDIQSATASSGRQGAGYQNGI